MSKRKEYNMSSLVDKLKEIKSNIEEYANALEDKRKSGRRTGNVVAPAEKSHDNIYPIVSWDDLANTLTDVQQKNPIVKRMRIRIIRLKDVQSVLDAHFRIEQVFLDEKGDVIYGEATRQSIVAKLWMTIKLDDKLQHLIGDSDRGEFSL